MKQKYKSLLLFLLFVLGNFSIDASNFSVLKNDSINAIILKEIDIEFTRNKQDNRIDSLQQFELRNQFSNLKPFEKSKKEEISQQIRDVRITEEQRTIKLKSRVDSLRNLMLGYPVQGFFKDTLFVMYNKSGSFSAEERAEAIKKRIHSLAGNINFNPESLLVQGTDISQDIVYGEMTLLSISERDAFWHNTSSNALAQKYRMIIAEKITKYQSEISLKTLAKEIALAFLVIFVTGLLIFYIGKIFRSTASKIKKQEEVRIKGLKFKDYTLLDAKRQISFLLKINMIIKWVVIFFVIYIALPILFGIFPWTKDFAEILFGYIINPVKRIAIGIWDYLPNLITIIVILIVFRYVLKGLNFLKSEIEKGDLNIPGFYPEWASPTYQIVRILVLAFMIVVIFPYLPNNDSRVFQGVSVFLGFLFTFSSAGSLSNIIAGLVLTYMRLFNIGDRVKIGEITGDVIEKSLLVTRIRTIKNEIISIPNSTVMNSHTINYSSDAPDKGLIIYSTVTIGYDVPWRKMHQALIDAALKTDLILKEPPPFVLQTSLDDFFVSYQINGYTREAGKQAVIYSNLHQNIQDICNERGIEIMSPHYLAARDGNASTIPDEYQNNTYSAPSFNVKIKKDTEN